MLIRTRRSARSLAVIAALALVGSATGLLPARAATNVFPDATFSGSAVGSTLHTDAINSGTTRVENADVALASAAVNSRRLTTQAVTENNRVINPALPTKSTYAKGQGLEVGLATTPPADGQVLLAGKAEASAPPTGPTVTKEQAVKVDPVAFASLVRGRADARWNDETCILGSDLSRGLAYAADVQLVDAGGNTSTTEFDAPVIALDDTDPERSVSQTVSRTKLVPNLAGTSATGTFGLLSEVRETIAPVTLLKGNANQITIELLGEWVLRVVATGTPGTASVFYGPASTTPDTPIVRITQGSSATNEVLKFQQIFGAAGFTLPPLDAVAEIAIGEDPRAIGGNAASSPAIAADGTSVSAAVDVVRVRLLGGTLGDIRIGHMEAKAAVPAGGITCPIPVSKKATPTTVTSQTAPDGKLQVAITIKNPFDCDLVDLSAIDVITQKSGDVTFKIVTDDPRNNPKAGAGATFTTISPTSANASYPALGTLKPGESKVINIVLSVTGQGEIQDIATAKGTLACPGGTALGEANARVGLIGSFTLVTRVDLKPLVRTGGADAALWLGLPLGAFLITRRALKRRALAS